MYYIGNKSTCCNWVFENGQVCSKTFSKPWSLVVHMRMHEDVRPFDCGLCDQTFRQKTHLKRHEKTHGILEQIFSKVLVLVHKSTPIIFIALFFFLVLDMPLVDMPLVQENDEQLEQHHGKSVMDVVENVNTSVRLLNCGICLRVFKTQALLKEHMFVHIKK